MIEITPENILRWPLIYSKTWNIPAPILPRTHWYVCWPPRKETWQGLHSSNWTRTKMAWSAEQNASMPSSPGSINSTKIHNPATWGESEDLAGPHGTLLSFICSTPMCCISYIFIMYIMLDMFVFSIVFVFSLPLSLFSLSCIPLLLLLHPANFQQNGSFL